MRCCTIAQEISLLLQVPSESGIARNVRTMDLKSNVLLIEKEGFSVVAATRVTQRFSTPGSKAS